MYFDLKQAQASGIEYPMCVGMGLAKVDTKDVDSMNSDSKALTELNNRIWYPPMQGQTRKRRREATWLKRGEVWSPYLPKSPDAGRPDSTVPFKIALSNHVLRPGQILALMIWAITSASSQDPRITYIGALNTVTTDSDLEDNSAENVIDYKQGGETSTGSYTPDGTIQLS